MTISNTERDSLIREFERSFHTVQLMRVWVDDETHAVNVKAHEIMLRVKKRIPIKMGLVQGRFSCNGCELETLENAPHTVTDNFACYNNLLESLVGGPQSVGSQSMGGGTYSCSGNFLKNFEGAPQDFEGYFVAVKQLGTGLESVDGLPPNARLVDITYQKHLPMLKLLKQKQVNIRTSLTGELMTDITDILNDHAPHGPEGIISCAFKLIKAGFKGSAKL
jgi:hypothetical protein